MAKPTITATYFEQELFNMGLTVAEMVEKINKQFPDLDRPVKDADVRLMAKTWGFDLRKKPKKKVLPFELVDDRHQTAGPQPETEPETVADEQPEQEGNDSPW